MTNPTEETQEEFEHRYTAQSSYPVVFGEDHISMPCTCEDGGGPTHWAAIINTPEMTALHVEDEDRRSGDV